MYKNKYFLKAFLFIILCSYLCTNKAFSQEMACPDFPFFQPTVGPLAYVNCDFHKAYEKQVAQMIKHFGAPDGRPILLDLSSTLIFKYNGKTETVNLTPPSYHFIKAFSHTAFSVWLILANTSNGEIDKEAKAALENLQTDLNKANNSLTSLGLSNAEHKVCHQLSKITQLFLKRMLKEGHWTPTELTQYLKAVRPLIYQSMHMASVIQLKTLSLAVESALKQLKKEEIKQLGVVIATSHQARRQDIGLQYFAKKFGYRYGDGAQFENNFVVLEGKFDENAALALLARHYLDREAARAILQDQARLQRDLLADAAKKILASNTLP